MALNGGSRIFWVFALVVLPSCVRTTTAGEIPGDGSEHHELSIVTDGSSDETLAGDAALGDGSVDSGPAPDVFDPCATGGDAGPAAPFAGGSGVDADPFLICDASQLNAIGTDPSLMQAHFRLLRDIDLAGISFNEIGAPGAPDEAFRGVFDGRGHTITNLMLETTNAEVHGLFRATEGARIHDLTLARAVIGSSTTITHRTGALVGLATDTTIERVGVTIEILGAGDAVGGLVGEMQGGSLRDVHVAGVVDFGPGADAVGGIAARLADVEVERAGAAVELRNTSSNPFGVSVVGGLVGMAVNSSLSDVYARGKVSFSNVTSVGPSGVSGLIGNLIGGSIARAYATGPVICGNPSASACFSYVDTSSGVESVFYDSESIGAVSGVGCDPLTTAELQSPARMLAAGFSPSVWQLVQGSYPELL